jgi:SAM-dependent methyltransferase
MESHQILKLNIGAGTNILPEWLNIDINPTHEEILFVDATVPLPFDNNSFDYVYSEHMIEHISFKEALHMLSEIHRILKPGGRVRISTPDIETIIGLFTSNKTESQKRYLHWSAFEMMGLYNSERSKLQIHRPEWDISHSYFETFFPDPKNDTACFVINNFFRSYGHKFLFDTKTLMNALESVGFVKIMRYSPDESDDEQFKRIEQHDSVIGNFVNQFESFVLEAARQ